MHQCSILIQTQYFSVYFSLCFCPFCHYSSLRLSHFNSRHGSFWPEDVMVTPDDTKFSCWHYEIIHRCKTKQMGEKRKKKRHRRLKYKTIFVQRVTCDGWHLVETSYQTKQSTHLPNCHLGPNCCVLPHFNSAVTPKEPPKRASRCSEPLHVTLWRFPLWNHRE